MVEVEIIQRDYPLHWLVWQNDYKQLETQLKQKVDDKEKKDNRGRTPLMLAVTLGHLESARALLNNEANVNCENSEGWTVVQEAVATGDPELVQMVLERRDFQRYSNRMAGIPELLQKLKEAPDFYVEMKWEFTSWVPLVSRMCPSDTYKVYKQGSNVRIDTTLLGFDHTSWQRGNRTYIFQGHSDGATMMEIDHDLHQIYSEEMQAPSESLSVLIPTEESISHRLTTPIITTYVDTDKISFERNKVGMWGWRSDKNESINGYQCKVFGASNVELVTKTRTEHLTESDKAKSKNVRTPLQNFLGIAEVEENVATSNNLSLSNSANFNSIVASPTNPSNIKPEEYFDAAFDLNGRDIGRPKEIATKVQKFKANLWLCEQYPLSLPEQILPIVDLMAISSSHFAKLKDFIQMQLPSGFPVKIEIPLFHVLNARITFGNIFAMDSPVDYVNYFREDRLNQDEEQIEENNENCRLTCMLDDCIFQCPPGYTEIGGSGQGAGIDGRRQFTGMDDEEDDLLQFAIQQSLIDVGTEKEQVDIWEALKAQKPSRPSTPSSGGAVVGEEERQLQRAIQASLELYRKDNNLNVNNLAIMDGEDGMHEDNNERRRRNSDEIDSDLHMALMLSEQECKKMEQQRMEEEKLLEEILQLSLTEK